jgi:hypothetical protein
MNFTLMVIIMSLGLFFAMVFVGGLSHRLRGRMQQKTPDVIDSGVTTIDAAVFGLLGLLVAFTFSGAAMRFDNRRQLIVQESNAIGTAYLRIDLLPASAQPALRDNFRKYVDAQLSGYEKLPDIAAARAQFQVADSLQKDIWNQTIAATRDAPPPAGMLLVPAVNDMIDVSALRNMAQMTHPPTIIYVILFILALASSLLAGYEMNATAPRKVVHMVIFAAILASTIYVILDLEYPRLGLIRIDNYNQVLTDLRRSMN